MCGFVRGETWCAQDTRQLTYRIVHPNARTNVINDNTSNIKQKEEIITLSINQKELLELEKLDGCYVIKTDLLDLDKNTIARHL